MLERTRSEGSELDERLRCWGEVLKLATAFYQEDTAAAHPANGSKNGKSGADSAAKAVRQSAVAATVLMSSLFQTFQFQMDGISGAARGSTTIGSSGTGSKGGRKNNQQDAVEFLTFLLDALHEEIIHAEAENARQAAEAALATTTTTTTAASTATSAAATSNSKSTATRVRNSSSPLLPGSATMSADDYDLLPISSRQNSSDMVIALTRQNSLAVAGEEKRDEAEEDEGWSTVGKASKSKVKAVVVDAESKERADSASKASVISRLFHATLR